MFRHRSYKFRSSRYNKKLNSFEYEIVLMTSASFTFRVVVIYRPPPSQPNGIKKSSFIEEFGDLMELTATLSGKLIVLGDFNVHVDCKSDPETTDLQSLFDCFDLVQHVDGATHKDGHTLDLVISRTTDNMVQSCEVGSFVGDHNAIYITMNCCKPHRIRKEISFRKIRSINTDSFSKDIRRIRIRIRIYLLARRNLLWDILRLPSSRRAALGLYVILTL